MPHQNKKRWRWLIWLVIVICAIPFLFQLLLQQYITSSLRDVEAALDKASNHTLRFHFDRVKVRIFTSSVTILGLQAEASDSVSNLSTFRTGNLTIQGIGLFEYFRHNKIIIEGISVRDAEINLRLAGKEKSNDEVFTLYALFREHVNAVYVDQISIVNTQIRYFEQLQDSVPLLVSENSSVLIREVLIDSAITYRFNRWFDAEEFLIRSDGFSYTTRDSLYTYSMGRVTLSYTDSVIRIDTLAMMPNYSEKQFGVKTGTQTDRIILEIQKTELTGIPVKDLLEKRKLTATLADVSGFKLHAYRDKKLPRKERIKPTLQELINSLPLYLSIDTVKVSDARVQYRELDVNGIRPGTISFDNIKAEITNLTNDSLAKKTNLVLTASCALMGSGQMELVMSVPYFINGAFNVSGELKTMPINKLNPILEHNAKVSVREGTITRAKFHFYADIRKSNGIMTLLYKDLKVDLLDKETEKRGQLMERVTTILANKLIIGDNPEEEKPVRTAALHYERNPNRFIFNYCWKTLFSGISETLGLNKIKGKEKASSQKKK